MKPTMTIRGTDQLVRKLEHIRREVRGATSIPEAGAEVLAEAWRDRVPVDEGHYRDSIEVVMDGPTAIVRVGRVQGVPDDEQPQLYAVRLEYGDEERAPQPSLRRAIFESRRQIADAMADETRDVIRRAS